MRMRGSPLVSLDWLRWGAAGFPLGDRLTGGRAARILVPASIGQLGMRLSLDRRGSLPLTDQLKAQIRHQIASGQLPVGSRIPPVRTLAGFLRVNRNTVARAYAELEAEGVLDATPGRGTFVVWAPPSRPP